MVSKILKQHNLYNIKYTLNGLDEKPSTLSLTSDPDHLMSQLNVLGSFLSDSSFSRELYVNNA